MEARGLIVLQGWNEMEPDVEISGHDIKQLGFRYLRRQVNNLKEAVKYLNSMPRSHLIEHDRQFFTSYLTNCWQELNALMRKNHLDQCHSFLQGTQPTEANVKPIAEHLVPELAWVANQLESHHIYHYAGIGKEVKVIASNISNCLHNFNSLRFVPGQFRATKYYPYGPQKALVRSLLELIDDSTQLLDDIWNLGFPLVQYQRFETFIEDLGLLSNRIENHLQSATIHRNRCEDSWIRTVAYLTNNEILPLARMERPMQDMVGNISGNLARIAMFMPSQLPPEMPE